MYLSTVRTVAGVFSILLFSNLLFAERVEKRKLEIEGAKAAIREFCDKERQRDIPSAQYVAIKKAHGIQPKKCEDIVNFMLDTETIFIGAPDCAGRLSPCYEVPKGAKNPVDDLRFMNAYISVKHVEIWADSGAYPFLDGLRYLPKLTNLWIHESLKKGGNSLPKAALNALDGIDTLRKLVIKGARGPYGSKYDPNLLNKFLTQLKSSTLSRVRTFRYFNGFGSTFIPADVGTLNRLKNVEEMSFEYVNLRAKEGESFKLPKLKKLRGGRFQTLSKDFAAHIGKILIGASRLEELELQLFPYPKTKEWIPNERVVFSFEGLEAHKHIKKIKLDSSLTSVFDGCKKVDHEVIIPDLETLKSLTLSGKCFRDSSVENLTSDSITGLILNFTKIKDLGFIGKLKGLVGVSVYGSINILNLNTVDLPSLKFLSVDKAELNGKIDLRTFRAPKLEHLRLDGNKITEIDFGRVPSKKNNISPRLAKLERLDLNNNRLTSLKKLKSLTGLKSLYIKKNPSLKQLHDLKGMKNLKMVYAAGNDALAFNCPASIQCIVSDKGN